MVFCATCEDGDQPQVTKKTLQAAKRRRPATSSAKDHRWQKRRYRWKKEPDRGAAMASGDCIGLGSARLALRLESRLKPWGALSGCGEGCVASEAWGSWCSGITSASHAEGPGFKSQWVHFSRTSASWMPSLRLEAQGGERRSGRRCGPPATPRAQGNSPHWGLNPGPSVYKTDALPLSYRGLHGAWSCRESEWPEGDPWTAWHRRQRLGQEALWPAARLAQSAERKALNLVVVGSSPTVGVPS